jgi:murein DD-endopeptidase MepM/ murein hydrolase activator NlpD
VVGATLKRVVAGGQKRIELDHGLPSEPPRFRTASEADHSRKRIEDLRKKTELNEKQKKALKWHTTVVQEREMWVEFMQIGLKMLKAYDGKITGRMDQDFGNVLAKQWPIWTAGKETYDPGTHGPEAARMLKTQLDRKKITNQDGIVQIPLPVDYVGDVEIEFLNIKILDPENAKTILTDEPGQYKPELDDRVDYDLETAKGENHKNDLAGSSEMLSRWHYVANPYTVHVYHVEVVASRATKNAPFQNFIKIRIKSPWLWERTKPIHKWTLALVWCQPVWTVVGKKYIYDPVNPHHESDPKPTATPPPGRRGLQGRGLANGCPTLLVNTQAGYLRSQFYGVFGTVGRNRLHNGIDCAGFVGDPVFAPVGGDITCAADVDHKSGNVINLKPLIPKGRLIQMAHLNRQDPFKVKQGDVVKAGDVIARMGRTPEGANFPPESPTHTHFIWGTKDDPVDLFNPPEGLEMHGAVLPHNGIPKVLPCGGDYPYGSNNTEDPRQCNCAYYVGGENDECCFAVAELACPFMLESISKEKLASKNPTEARAAARRLQAQLKWLSKQPDKNADGNYLDPGPIDGSLGPLPCATMTSHKSTIRDFITDTLGVLDEWPFLFDADKGEVFDLFDEDMVPSKPNGSDTTRYKLKLTDKQAADHSPKDGKPKLQAGVVLVHQSECRVTHSTNTRKAIKRFNEDYDPSSGYEMSDEGIKQLNNLTSLTKDARRAGYGLRLQQPSDPLPEANP